MIGALTLLISIIYENGYDSGGQRKIEISASSSEEKQNYL